MSAPARRLLAALATFAALTLTACGGGWRMSTDLMEELAEARDTCDRLGGKFEQWRAEAGVGWLCNFDQTGGDS